MFYQDWKPVILRKNTKPKQTHTSRPSKKNDLDDPDYVSKKKVSHKLKMQIQHARQAKKLTQKELANKCNIPLNIVRDYENGKAIPNAQHLNKMRRVLGCKLSNK